MLSNDAGISNTASCVNALYSNTEGNYNTGMGQDALFSNATGTDNSALGYKQEATRAASYRAVLLEYHYLIEYRLALLRRANAHEA